ncbi:ABC transporter permease [Herbiconiux liukaitaii]|uniref:ABC transporter permease n=1 Tax=Herbiconiux liukaitaii TaxID=3342799 RepID=UPI0035BA9D91
MSAPAQPRTTFVQAPERQRFAHILHAELIKLTSLRSTVLLIAAMIGLGLGVSLLYALTAEQGGIPDAPSTPFLLDAVTLGTLIFSQIIAGVLGVLTITSEYSSGTIQPTLAAVPRRPLALAAKALVLFPLMVLTALVTLLGSWAVTYPVYAELGIQVGLDAPGFAFALVGGAVYVGLCSVFGLGIGTLLRSAAGGSVVVICSTLLAPILTSVLPTSEVVRTIRLYLLSHAGDSMVRLGDPALGFADATEQYLSPAGGWITAVAWALVALAAGASVLRRRDA